MKKCCVCNAALNEENIDILFIGANGDKKEICNKCRQQLTTLTNGDNPAQINESITYLNQCLPAMDDFEVYRVVNRAVSANRVAISEIPRYKKRRTSVGVASISDSFLRKDSGKSSQTWIVMLIMFQLVSFVGIIIIGIWAAVEIGGGLGALLVLGSIVSAITSFSLAMVLVYVSTDVSEIKLRLRRKDKK